MKGLLYVLVLFPLWSSYLVRVYAWRLILAKEGITNWIFSELNLDWLLRSDEGAALRVGAVPAVVVLPGASLCLAPDPRQGRHHQLDLLRAQPGLAAQIG